MDEKINNVISRIVIETLEQLAFMFSSPDDEVSPINSDSMAVTVPFTGPFSGRLTMETTTSVIIELTANMLGIDEEDITAGQKTDALKETVNILCGNLLPAIGGDQAIFNINAPTIVNIEEVGETEKAFSTTSFSIDDEICKIYLFVDGDMDESLLNIE